MSPAMDYCHFCYAIIAAFRGGGVVIVMHLINCYSILEWKMNYVDIV